MIGALRAEQIKLTTIRSPYWCVGLAVILSLGVTGLFAGLADNTDGTPVDGETMFVALIGLHQFAVIVLMIMAILGITSEHRFGTIRSTFLAVPKRPVALVAKAVVYVGLTFLVMLILTVICVLVLKAGITGVDLGSSGVIRQIWGIPVYAALCVLLSIGVGALIRQTAGAISLVLVWMLVIETILSAVPKVSDWAAPLLPFGNGTRFLSGVEGSDYHWGPTVSLIYFAIWAIVIFVIGVVVTDRRDA